MVVFMFSDVSVSSYTFSILNHYAFLFLVCECYSLQSTIKMQILIYPTIQHSLDQLWLVALFCSQCSACMSEDTLAHCSDSWMANTMAGHDGLGGQSRQRVQPIGSEYWVWKTATALNYFLTTGSYGEHIKRCTATFSCSSVLFQIMSIFCIVDCEHEQKCFKHLMNIRYISSYL